MHHIKLNTTKQVAAKDEQKVGKINHFFCNKIDFLGVVLSELAVINGLPICVLAKSQNLKASLERKDTTYQ